MNPPFPAQPCPRFPCVDVQRVGNYRGVTCEVGINSCSLEMLFARIICQHYIEHFGGNVKSTSDSVVTPNEILSVECWDSRSSYGALLPLR